MPIIRLEGQEIPLTSEQAQTDQAIIDTLLPFYPQIAGATFERQEIEGETIIKIRPRAGTKGNSLVVQALKEAPSEINQALIMSWQLKQLEITGKLDIPTLIQLQPQIEEAISLSQEESQATHSITSTLVTCSPTPSPFSLLGF